MAAQTPRGPRKKQYSLLACLCFSIVSMSITIMMLQMVVALLVLLVHILMVVMLLLLLLVVMLMVLVVIVLVMMLVVIIIPSFADIRTKFLYPSNIE